MCSSARWPSGSGMRWAAGSRGRLHRSSEGRSRHPAGSVLPGAGSVSESWFYKWQRGDESPQRARRERLRAEIPRLFAAHRGKRRITAAHRRPARGRLDGEQEHRGSADGRDGPGRPARSQAPGRNPAGQGPVAGTGPGPAGLPRGQAINRKWYGDGTEIPTGEGKLHLASVLDMGSRRILGFALGEHHDADLAYGALAMAVAVRGGAVPGVIMHTDQGSEYTAGRFRAACERLSIRQSMGRPGLGAGQRGHRIVALHPGIRAAAHRALRDQGGRPGRDRGVDRGLQPPPQALLAGHGSPRWITSGPWRERTPRDRGRPLRGPDPEGGGFAARSDEAAAPGWGTRRAGYGAAPPASRVLRIALRATARRAALDPGDLGGPWQAGKTGRPSLPRPGARRAKASGGRAHTDAGEHN